jgi:hypothetical protein
MKNENRRAATFLVVAFLFLLNLSGCSDNHGLHPVPITGISGTITFEGQWPANTEFVRVAVYQTYPPPSLIALAAVSDPLPFGVQKTDYILPLKPGTYGWILVAWKAKNTPFTAIRTLGVYYAAGDSTRPGSVTVEKNRLTPHVDIGADFGVLVSP